MTFPVQITPDKAIHELTEINKKIIKGIEQLSTIKEDDVQVGQTPKDVVFQEGKLKLYRYRPVVEKPFKIPLLFSYALVNRYMVADLQEDLHSFLRDDGHPANQSGIRYALQTLCQQLGWQPRGDYPHHRLHDLRHTYIVRATLRFYEQGIDVDRAVLALSTYVGHTKVSDTYWYFTGIPELMAIAAERFHSYTQGATR